MVDEVETPRILDELSKKNAATAAEKPRGSLLARLWRLLVRLVLFTVVVAGLGFLAYQQWLLNARVQQLSTDNSQLQNQVAASTGRIADLEARLALVPDSPAVTEAVTDALQAEFNGRLLQLNSDLADLRSQFSGSIAGQETRWRLLEAEYLHRLANRHLLLTADVPATIALLESVDQLLVDAGDGRVAPARNALAAELEELRSLQGYDPELLFARIDAVRQQVSQLQVTAESLQQAYLARLAEASSNDSPGAGNALATRPTGSEGDDSATALDAALDFLGSVFIWRDWQDTDAGTEPPEALFVVAGTIDLLLQQAQLAVLTQRPAVFRDSLQRARELTFSNQVGLGEPASQVLIELDRLLAEQPIPDLPELDRSLELVEQLTPNPLPGSQDQAQ